MFIKIVLAINVFRRARREWLQVSGDEKKDRLKLLSKELFTDGVRGDQKSQVTGGERAQGRGLGKRSSPPPPAGSM